jgi:phytoene dehydrogenase-like protein
VAEPGKVKWKPWVDSLKKQVADFVPGIERHTEFCVASSPDMIACENGRIYGDAVGVAQTIDQMGASAPSALSPIKGLYNVGADVGSSGIATEMATQSAIDLFETYLKS